MKVDVVLLGIAVIIFWGLWGFLYKIGLSRLGLARALLWSSIAYGFTNLLIVLFLVYKGTSFSGSGREIVMAGSLFATLGSLLFLFYLSRYQVSTVVPLTALYPAVSVTLGILVLGGEN
ncbi:MAG: EamA family transporter [Candidatus Hydrothermarchaeaceae archaeon]